MKIIGAKNWFLAAHAQTKAKIENPKKTSGRMKERYTCAKFERSTLSCFSCRRGRTDGDGLEV